MASILATVARSAFRKAVRALKSAVQATAAANVKQTKEIAKMPAFVIVQQLGKLGDAVDAVLCAPGALGFPDRKTDVPVRVRLVSEQVLCVDDEPRRIVSSVGESGTTTFLINVSASSIRNGERRAALARASGLLQQLASSLTALAAESEERGFVAENLQLLFDWIREERERATAAPQSIGASKGVPS